MNESHKKTLLKTLSWRAFATIYTVVVSWIITGNLSHGITIGIFDFFLKGSFYYIHERAWIKFSKNH
jgi:uncharacterized membrane protein